MKALVRAAAAARLLAAQSDSALRSCGVVACRRAIVRAAGML